MKCDESAESGSPSNSTDSVDGQRQWICSKSTCSAPTTRMVFHRQPTITGCYLFVWRHTHTHKHTFPSTFIFSASNSCVIVCLRFKFNSKQTVEGGWNCECLYIYTNICLYVYILINTYALVANVSLMRSIWAFVLIFV